MKQDPKSRLAFALDYPSLDEAQQGASLVSGEVGVLKVGLELFIKEGPAAVKMASETGCDVFLDLKLHDIQKTVERAVSTAASLGVRYLTIHTAGGPGMMEAAAACAQKEDTGLKVAGVTVLTSLSEEDLKRVGVSDTASLQAGRLALLAKECGLQALVCSSQEVSTLRTLVGPQMILITPGIRPKGSAVGDQKRVGTPGEAVKAGSDLLVVGRPIRDATDPAQAARDILSELAGALHS